MTNTYVATRVNSCSMTWNESVRAKCNFTAAYNVQVGAFVKNASHQGRMTFTWHLSGANYIIDNTGTEWGKFFSIPLPAAPV